MTQGTLFPLGLTSFFFSRSQSTEKTCFQYAREFTGNKCMWLVLLLCFIHVRESLLVSQGMSKTFYPYLAFIAAEHIREGVELGVQVGNGWCWVEQCFHYKRLQRFGA